MRYYSNLAQEMTLTAAVAAGDTVLALSSVGGLPSSFPFTLVIDVGESNEEVVTCTALFGTSATVIRGEDGTSATSHTAAAKVRHMLSKRDVAEPQQHIAASTSVHGVTGSVVGTTDTQTLTNKSLSGSTNTFTNVPKSAIPSDTCYIGATQTLTNKTLDGGSNTFTNLPKSALPSTVVYTSDLQTLTNKTLDGASNTFTNIDVTTSIAGVVPKANLVSEDWADRSKGSSWSTGTLKSKLSGGQTSIYASMTRDASLSTATSTSTVMFSLATAYRPPYDWPVIATHVVGNETRFFRVVISASTGEATLTVDQGSGNLSAAAPVTLAATWPTV